MTGAKRWLLWVGVALLAVGIAWLCFKLLPSSPFCDSFLGNWLATMIGVIFGIPIALELNRWQQGQEEKERTKKILVLVKQELEHNRRAVSKRQPAKPDQLYRGVPSSLSE